jgi:hypothetical protein
MTTPTFDSSTVTFDSSRWTFDGGDRNNVVLTAACGVFSLAGEAVSIYFSPPKLAAAAGIFALSGGAATLSTSQGQLSAAAGIFSLSGESATLSQNNPGGSSYTLEIGFNLTPLVMIAQPGVFQIQGAPSAITSQGSSSYSIVANSGSFTVSGQAATLSQSTVLPAAPANVLLLLQGQTSANNTPSPPVPSSPNYQKIGWTAAVAGSHPVASYKVYRGVNGATPTLYASGITGTTYADTAATSCVNGTPGTTAPYYQANSYVYLVSAVDTLGNEGPQSAAPAFQIYKNGFNWGGDFANGETSNFADTSGLPNGSSTSDIKVSMTAQYGETLYYAGNLVTSFNMWVGAFNYLSIDLKTTSANPSFALYALRAGDHSLYDSTGTAYSINPLNYGPAPVVGQWATYKIPLSAFLTDYGPSGAGTPVVQNAFYKFAFQDKTGASSNAWFFDNIILSAT